MSNFAPWSEGAPLDIFDVFNKGLLLRILDFVVQRPGIARSSGQVRGNTEAETNPNVTPHHKICSFAFIFFTSFGIVIFVRGFSSFFGAAEIWGLLRLAFSCYSWPGIIARGFRHDPSRKGHGRRAELPMCVPPGGAFGPIMPGRQSPTRLLTNPPARDCSFPR